MKKPKTIAKKDKCKVLHLGQSNPDISTDEVMNRWIESGHEEKDLGTLGGWT